MDAFYRGAMANNKSFFSMTHMFLPIRENVGVFIVIGSFEVVSLNDDCKLALKSF